MPFKILLVIIVLALPLVPTFWSILDIPKRRFSSRSAKMIWFAVVASLPFFGAMIYILFVRKNTQPASASDKAADETPPGPEKGLISSPEEANQGKEEI